MKLTISFQSAQGPKPKAQHPQVVERKKPGMPCPFDLTQVFSLPSLSRCLNLSGPVVGYLFELKILLSLQKAAALAASRYFFLWIKSI